MSFIGAGTRNSPISIHDSEEEVILELTYDEFYRGPSSNKSPGIDLPRRSSATSWDHQLGESSTGPGKRKRQEDEPLVASSSANWHLTASLENRISQPESKKARKRRRKAERQALELEKLRGIDWLTNPTSPGFGELESQPQEPYLHARLNFELDYGTPEEAPYCPKNETLQSDLSLGLPSLRSEWVSSMVIAGEFPNCKAVEKAAPHPPPIAPMTQLPPAPKRMAPVPPPPAPPPEILPPIYIRPDFVMSTETRSQTPVQVPPQTIGMKPDQDANSKHGIFHFVESTVEAGTGVKKRAAPYLPNPARTLVMEQLPKTDRTTEFVGNWCRSACGVPALHLFVDPPSAKALIEFATADLARKAWASPRLGQNLVGVKSHLLKGKARQDLIKVWWYRVDGVGAGAGVGEIEEGEIEGDIGAEKQQHDPLRKETKKERKARLAKAREQSKAKEMKSMQKAVEETSASNRLPPSSVTSIADQAQVEIFPLRPVSDLFPFSSPFDWDYPPWKPASQLPSQHPPPISYSTLKTDVGSSLTRGGHDDSASIASSNGRPSPDRTIGSSSSSKVVVATTLGQADDLADYCELDMAADMDVDIRSQVTSTSTAPTPSSTYMRSTFPTSHAPTSSKNGPVSIQHSGPGRKLKPGGNARNAPRSKQQQQQQQRKIQPLAQPPPTSISTTRETRVLPTAPSHDRFLSTSSAPPRKGQHSLPPPTSMTPRPSVVNSLPLPVSSLSNFHSAGLPKNPTRAKVRPDVAVHSDAKHAAGSRNLLDERVTKGKMGSTVAGTHQVGFSIIGKSSDSMPTALSPVAPTFKPVNGNPEGQAIEESLRQRVFANKNKVKAPCQASAPSDMIVAPAIDTIPVVDVVEPRSSKTSLDAPSPVTLSTSSFVPTSSASDTISFEDLAVTFITETIETVKAKPQPQPQSQQRDPQRVDSSGSSISSAATSISATPPPATPSISPIFNFASLPTNTSSGGVGVPAKLPLTTTSSANYFKAELTAKQNRLEQHIQESKNMMERILTAKTKQEKDLLLKIMREKTRLFEEENKASERKITKLKVDDSNGITVAEKTIKNQKPTRSTMTLQLQQWPTTQYSSVLILSDDED